MQNTTNFYYKICATWRRARIDEDLPKTLKSFLFVLSLEEYKLNYNMFSGLLCIIF